MKEFNFVKNRKIFFIITAAVILLGIVCMAVRGFNIDTDFAGGTTMQINIGKTLDAAELDNIRAVTEGVIGTTVSGVQKSGTESTEVLIKMKEIGSETREAVFDALAEKYSLTDADLLDTTNVGASMSADLRRSAVLATLIAVLLMLVYIAIRFRFTSALAAVVCLCHDLFIMVAAYSLFAIPMQSTMIAALLTILGYSINATIIVFDRIREGMKGKKDDPETVANRSIRSTLTRSINTTLTTLFTIGMIYILGVDSIRAFALPLIVGIIAGLYSSVCLAGNIWLILERCFAGLRKKKA